MDIEKECTLLGNLFHHIVTDLKVHKKILFVKDVKLLLLLTYFIITKNILFSLHVILYLKFLRAVFLMQWQYHLSCNNNQCFIWCQASSFNEIQCIFN